MARIFQHDAHAQRVGSVLTELAQGLAKSLKSGDFFELSDAPQQRMALESEFFSWVPPYIAAD